MAHHPADSESPASLVPFVQTPRADSPLPFQLRAPVPVRYDLICMISPGSSWYLPFPFDLYHRYKTVPLLTTSLSYPFGFHFRMSGPFHVFLFLV